MNWWDNPAIVTRFESKFDRGAPDECWPWKAGLSEPGVGYGELGGSSGGRNWKLRAHRMALELKIGRSLRPGEMALHSCDNPPCVNPRHLRVGAEIDNSRDRMERGRQLAGEAHGSSKLSEVQVAMIRRIFSVAKPPPQRVVAQMYGVNQSMISRIVNRRNWK